MTVHMYLFYYIIFYGNKWEAGNKAKQAGGLLQNKTIHHFIISETRAFGPSGKAVYLKLIVCDDMD